MVIVSGTKLKKMKLSDIQEVSSGKDGNLKVNYNQVVEKVFEPNVTELDDPDKVGASWGFQDDKGRKAFVWSYKFYGEIEDCNTFSVSGDRSLLKDLFADKVVFY